MLAIVRRQKIVDVIQEKKKVLVQQLALDFSVTEETIRRDLEKLEDQGILKRTYGGAVINEGTNMDTPIVMREIVNKDGKLRIAKKVECEINDGDTLMLDSSSTAFYVAKCLKEGNKKVTIITNSLKVVSELQNNGNVNIILAGGNFRGKTKSFIGKWAESVLNNYYVNKAIICCKGMDIKRGIMDSSEEEAQIKKMMMKSANEVILVVDNIKFNKSSFVKVSDFDKINYLYTDMELSKDWNDLLKENNVEIKVCE